MNRTGVCRRDELRKYLASQGVETLIHWPKPLWEHEGLALGNPRLAETAAICNEVVSLPMSAETTEEQVAIINRCIQEFFASQTARVHAMSLE